MKWIEPNLFNIGTSIAGAKYLARTSSKTGLIAYIRVPSYGEPALDIFGNALGWAVISSSKAFR